MDYLLSEAELVVLLKSASKSMSTGWLSKLCPGEPSSISYTTRNAA